MADNRVSAGSRAAALSLILSCLILVIINMSVVPVAEAIWLTIPSSKTKCVQEELHNNVVVVADYFVINEQNPEHPASVSTQVTSPYGHNLYNKGNLTVGQFAFTSAEAGPYYACFTVDQHHGNLNLTLLLDWKIGIAAKDWDSVAKKEKIEGVELNLTKLQGHVQAVHDNLLYLRQRESQMRKVNERTNSRVAWYSMMSVGICIVASVLQVVYLKRYFQKKKLI